MAGSRARSAGTASTGVSSTTASPTPSTRAARSRGVETMLKVWGRRSSANVQKVMWLVGELELAHEHIPAGGPYGRVNEPNLRAMNPHRLVPGVEEDRLGMWGSQAV